MIGKPLVDVLFVKDDAVRKKTLPVTFASRLRELRESAGITSAQLADAAGIARATYSRYESGHREPTWRALYRIVRALRADANIFLDCLD